MKLHRPTKVSKNRFWSNDDVGYRLLQDPGSLTIVAMYCPSYSDITSPTLSEHRPIFSSWLEIPITFSDRRSFNKFRSLCLYVRLSVICRLPHCVLWKNGARQAYGVYRMCGSIFRLVQLLTPYDNHKYQRRGRGIRVRGGSIVGNNVTLQLTPNGCK